MLNTSTHGQQGSVWLSSVALGVTFHTNIVHTRHSDTSGDVSIYFCLQKMMGGCTEDEKNFQKGPCQTLTTALQAPDLPPRP